MAVEAEREFHSKGQHPEAYGCGKFFPIEVMEPLHESVRVTIQAEIAKGALHILGA
jgi:hypothetical protein